GTDGRAEQVDLAIAVEVSGADRPRFGHLVADEVLRPFPIPALLAGILVPGDAIARVPRNRRIQVAIPVQVGQDDVIGPRAPGGDDVALPGAGGGPVVVGEPDEVTVPIVDDGDIRLAIAVDIADGVALEPAGLVLGNDMPLERPLAIVL